MDRLFEPVPPDFPWLGGQPIWLACIVILGLLVVGTVLNNAYFAWLHRHVPVLFRPRVLLAIFGLCIVVIAIGLSLNPPSEMQKSFQRSQQSGP
jgi:hypothetical protein